MTSPKGDAIVEAYTKRLKASLASLPAARRKELTVEISDHIAQARAQLSEESEADVLTILERLGEPEEIASEATDTGGTAEDAVPETAAGAHEMLALGLIGIGGVIFPVAPVGWLLGTGLIWRSKAWTPEQKLYGAYLPFVIGLAILLLGAIAAGLGPNTTFAFFAAAVLDTIVLPVGVAIYLGAKIARRVHWLGWLALAILAALVYLPAVSTVMPPRASAYVGPDGPSGGPMPVAGEPGCGGLYATVYSGAGTPVQGRQYVSVGICWDGQTVTKRWGPDCNSDYGPGLIVEVQQCDVESPGDGSVIISLRSKTQALTAPFFISSASEEWRVSPDGRVEQLGP